MCGGGGMAMNADNTSKSSGRQVEQMVDITEESGGTGVFDDQDLINVEDPSMVLLMKLKDVKSISNILSAENFQTNTSLKSVYSCIKTSTPSFKVDERLIWIEIRGLPLCAWRSNAYKKLADMFGKFIQWYGKVEDSIDENSLANLNDLKETINELASNKIQHPIYKENMDQEDDINKVSPEIAISLDLSQPPGFEHMKRISNNSGLIDLPLGGHLFTWMNKVRTKLSKLDQFLISEEVDEALPDVLVTAIDCLWSDHNPILLHVSKSDSGPTPFKLFSFLLLQEVDRLDTFESFDLFQKARVKWDIEHDENSKFFHWLIKQKRRAQMIHGIMKEGVWISDPSQIKEEFLNFFKEKFKDYYSNVDFPQFANSSGLCALDRDSLETHVSLDEVKNRVWDCGSSKAPGPDRYSFAFVKKY
ncbi:RNA-directed DNA polymerase, eukaryota, reverse transcriptase zinc-binding domain protein [Tanacetum coccineum]